MKNRPAPILAPLSTALQGGYTFTISGPDTITATHISGKVTTFRIGPTYYYPTAGKQPTKAQTALIAPVLQAIAAHGVEAWQLDPPYIAANAPPPRQRRARAPGWGLVAAGYAFAPVYFLGSLLWGTAKHYK
jgi:hypothetical protein